MREFETGATRDSDEDKPHIMDYLSPLAMAEYGRYMLKHEQQADGTKRDPANWKKGIPEKEYFSSLGRHFLLDLAPLMENMPGRTLGVCKKEALCAIMFNAQGMLHELLLREEKTSIEERLRDCFMEATKPKLVLPEQPPVAHGATPYDLWKINPVPPQYAWSHLLRSPCFDNPDLMAV